MYKNEENIDMSYKETNSSVSIFDLMGQNYKHFFDNHLDGMFLKLNSDHILQDDNIDNLHPSENILSLNFNRNLYISYQNTLCIPFSNQCKNYEVNKIAPSTYLVSIYSMKYNC